MRTTEAGTPPRLIGVDWGTSAMRAILCRPRAAGPAVPEILAGPGVAAARGTFAEALFTTIEPWIGTYGKLPVIMSGMIGSNIGWQVVRYLDCPFPVRSLHTGLQRFEADGHRLAIVPGVACRNVLGEPDFMRGEELQILGWMQASERHGQGEHVLCLPGTHTKWVRFENGRILTFLTALSGELYSVLCRHSILLSGTRHETPVSFDEPAFLEGLRLARHSGGALLNTLFSVRSRRIADAETVFDASGYLSGLVIGTDVMSGMARFAPTAGVVELIGDPALCRKFALALELFGVGATVTDGIEAARHGFLCLGEPQS